MEAVKIYQDINSNDGSINFSVSRMEDIYERRGGRVDEPHRHNYYTVLVVNKAKGLHKIDFNSYSLGENQLFFVAPGQVHQVIEEEKSYGYVMVFSNLFLIENSIPISFIESLNLFQNYGQSPPLILDEKKFKTVEDYTHKILDLYNSQEEMKWLSIGSFLKLLLIQCNNACSINPLESDVDATGDNLIRAFRKKVEEHYTTEHSTSFYANALHISPDHLNRTFKSRTGTTAKEYIQTRIITEAKRLIYFTDLTAKEIAYQLGFSEPGNFSAFFKKHTKMSPTEFKNGETLV